MSILLAKHIKTKLGASNVSGLVGGRIFYLGSRTEQPLPYISFDYNTSSSRDTKDGEWVDSCNVTVDVYAKDAQQMSNICIAVRSALNNELGEYPTDGFEVTESEYTSFSGVLDDDSYHGELTFNIETTKI